MFVGGAITPAVFPISSKNAAKTLMVKHDVDKDNKLNIDEAGLVNILSRQNFPKADSMKDGKLTETELVNYIDKIKLEFQMSGSSNNALGAMLAGAPVTKANFSAINVSARQNQGKLGFLKSMQSINETYQKYQTEGKFDKYV